MLQIWSASPQGGEGGRLSWEKLWVSSLNVTKMAKSSLCWFGALGILPACPHLVWNLPLSRELLSGGIILWSSWSTSEQDLEFGAVQREEFLLLPKWGSFPPALALWPHPLHSLSDCCQWAGPEQFEILGRCFGTWWFPLASRGLVLERLCLFPRMEKFPGELQALKSLIRQRWPCAMLGESGSQLSSLIHPSFHLFQGSGEWQNRAQLC